MIETLPHSSFQVACLNILMDDQPGSRVEPQSERLPGLAKLLRQEVSSEAIIGICEAEGDNVRRLAELLGLQEYFSVEHDRPNEHIGLMGPKLPNTRELHLGYRSMACITEYSDTAVAMVHLNDKILGSGIRSAELANLTEELAPWDHAAIIGDFNALWWQRPRRQLNQAGFHSVFTQLGVRHFPKMPTPEYKQHLERYRKVGVALGSLGRGFSLDAMYVRGLSVVGAGSFRGDSDHPGLQATLSPADPEQRPRLVQAHFTAAGQYYSAYNGR